MGPLLQPAKNNNNLLHVNSVFFVLSDNSCTVKLMSESTRNYRKQFVTAVLCPTLLSGLSSIGCPSPSIFII